MDDTRRKDCKDCEERNATCHLYCPIYKGNVEKNEKKKAALQEQRKINGVLCDYSRAKKEKLKRRRHKKAT